jgi:hypothetical protein
VTEHENEPSSDKRPKFSWESVVTAGMSDSQVRGFIVMSWRVLVLIHIAWVCGLLGSIGLSAPFAKAQTAVEIQKEIREDRLERIEVAIYESQLAYCSATDQFVKRYYSDRRLRLMARYRQITGQNYPLPTCQEI